MNEFVIFIRGIYIDILSHLHRRSSLNSKLSANTNSSIGKAKLQNTGISSLFSTNWKMLILQSSRKGKESLAMKQERQTEFHAMLVERVSTSLVLQMMR